MFEARSLVCSKEITVEQVLQCLLGLRKLEIEIYCTLLEKPGTPDEICRRLNKSRSIVQRGLQNLIGYGMAYRRPVSKARGRAFEYLAVPKEDVKKSLRKTLEVWVSNIEKAINEW
jgi:predicted transcriptional regulator